MMEEITKVRGQKEVVEGGVEISGWSEVEGGRAGDDVTDEVVGRNCWFGRRSDG